MLQFIKKCFKDFTYTYRKYLSFGLLYMVFKSIFVVPLISFIFNRMLRMISSGSLLNADIYKIGMSSTGLFAMLFISFLAAIFLLVEFGVMILIAQQNYFNRNISIIDGFVTTISKLPKLLSFGLVQLLLLTLIFIPFIELPAFPALLDFNMPIFLTSQLYNASYFSMFSYIALILVALYLGGRTIFVLHYLFIDEKSIWEAIKASWEITKSNKLKIIPILIVFNAVLFFVGFLFVTILSYIPIVTNMLILGHLIESYLITFSSILAVLFSLLLIPLNIIIVTRLFYSFKKNKGEDVKDKLTIHHSERLTIVEKQIVHFFAKRKATLMMIIFLFVTGMFIFNQTVNDNLVYLKWNVQVAAHRGDASNAPENSLSSIKSAIEKGVDAVEIDVMLTKDEVVILNHDINLQRVAGNPTDVSEMTYEQLSQIDIGHSYSTEFTGEKIPSLAEVLEVVKQENVTLIIDLKGSEPNGKLAEKVVDLIEHFEMEDETYIQAFDYKTLQAIRNRNSKIKIGQIIFLSAGNLAELDVDFYTIRQTMLSERFIKNAQKQNREVWVWTVNIERNMREVLKYDIDGIITDYPEKVQTIIGIDLIQE